MIALALIAVALALPALAHTGDTLVPIYELPSSELPDLHDGSLEDWDAVLPNASLTHDDFVGLESPEPDNLAWRVFIGWHFQSQRIYVGIERLDDDYVPIEADEYSAERIDLIVDGDHSGGEYAFFEGPISHTERERRWNSQAQSYHVKPELHPVFGQYILGGGLTETWSTQPPWTEIGASAEGEVPHRSVMEFYVTPWDDLFFEGPESSRRTELRPGQIIGLNVRVFDVDSHAPKWFYVFELGRDPAHRLSLNADSLVDAELIPCQRQDCSQGQVSAVEGISWARIKASFAQ